MTGVLWFDVLNPRVRSLVRTTAHRLPVDRRAAVIRRAYDRLTRAGRPEPADAMVLAALRLDRELPAFDPELPAKATVAPRL